MTNLSKTVAVPSTGFFPNKKDRINGGKSMYTLRREMLAKLSQEEITYHYNLLKARVLKKSEHAYMTGPVEERRDPESLELYGLAASFDLPVRYVVEYNSFELLLDDNKQEIGFKAIVKNGHVDDRLELIVWKGKYEAKVRSLQN